MNLSITMGWINITACSSTGRPYILSWDYRDQNSIWGNLVETIIFCQLISADRCPLETMQKSSAFINLTCDKLSVLVHLWLGGKTAKYIHEYLQQKLLRKRFHFQRCIWKDGGNITRKLPFTEIKGYNCCLSWLTFVVEKGED